ncbi:MAG: PEP-utilizing enzyme [Patescibacteria group bacterium]|jgi:phosphohistidine swiveling domain-containing protein
MKIDIDPLGELFKWGPIDGKLIYPDFFNIAFIKFQKDGFFSWPDLLLLAGKEKILFVLNSNALYNCGRKNFKKFIMVDNNFKYYYRLWQKNLSRWLDFQKTISFSAAKDLSNKELYLIFKTWADSYINFWVLGLLPEVANWGGEITLKEKLEKLVPAKDFIYIYERLSAPINLSFYQQAELDLLKLKKFSKKPKLFKQKLANHQKKYFWILNSYHHTRILAENYFRMELANYSLKKAQTKIKELENHSKRVKKEKDQIIKKYHLKPEIRKIADRLAFCIWWQDLRKYYIFLANHYIDLFIKEFCRRYNLDFSSLHYYSGFEILKLAKDQKIIFKKEIASRYKNLVVFYSEKKNKLEYISGPLAKKISSRYTAVKVDKTTKKFKGLVVSRGKIVRAKVRILTSVANFGQMKKGEVLVAAMTSPDYIVAIKKASAIVTDEGGMTSHAAIVSRELKIPCIVNTKIATKVLHDGDLVEVNTNQGVVTILKK